MTHDDAGETTTRRTLLRRSAGVVLGTGLLPWLTACGDDDFPPHRAAFLLDVSGSSLCGRNSNLYVQSLLDVSKHVGTYGTGEIWVRFVAGNPLGQTDYPFHVGPEHPNGSFKKQEVARRVGDVARQLVASMQNPPAMAPGSHIVESIAAMTEKLGALKSGDVIAMLSDGYQFSDILNFGASDTSPAGRKAALDALAERDLMPDLSGITLYFPELLTRADASAGLTDPGCTGYRASDGRLERGKEFWSEYADRTGAKLVLGSENLKL